MSENKHVYEAIINVQRDISQIGISKDQINQQQKWSFRGIDDMLNTMSPILAKHSLCILPKYVSRIVDERKTKGGAIWWNVIVKGEFHLVSAKDGSTHIVEVYGEGMDPQDKATNKAMSIALKYLYIQAFQIPIIGSDDPDSKVVESYTPHPNSKEAREQKEKDRNDNQIFGVFLQMLLNDEKDLFLEGMNERSEEEKQTLWKLFTTTEKEKIREWKAM